MNNEFEEFAEKYGFSLDKFDSGNYKDIKTIFSKHFWDAQQVKIDKLEHDLAGEKCANRMLTHVLDNATKARTS